MIRPLQALLIAPAWGMQSECEFGFKQLTIRRGHRDYQVGPVILCCHIKSWCMQADITSVRHCKLKELSLQEIEDDGFVDYAAMLTAMSEFYPDLHDDSEITVIRWANARHE